MTVKKNIVAIIGSASQNSGNLKLVENLAGLTATYFNLTVIEDLKKLPHFDPALSVADTPEQIVALREQIEKADGLLICTPEYVFSIPSGLKNAIEWLVATTILDGKPTGLITASASGEKAHEELKLIMKTLMAQFTEATTLLIQGIKGKINENGEIAPPTKAELLAFSEAFKILVNNASSFATKKEV